MTNLQQIFLASGAFFGLLGVAGGAFGAHFLKNKFPPNFLNIFEIGIRYQMYHALLLVCLALLLSFAPSTWFVVAGWLVILGVVIFSGSLYALVFSGVKELGMVTPIGGVFLLIGWLCLLLGSLLGGSA